MHPAAGVCGSFTNVTEHDGDLHRTRDAAARQLGVTATPRRQHEGFTPASRLRKCETLLQHPDGNAEIYVMNADGSGLQNLTNDPAWTTGRLSPDGTRMLFELWPSLRE